MQACGSKVDHSTLDCRVLGNVPLPVEALHARKRLAGYGRRMVETYVTAKDAWKYSCRPGDKAGVVDFLLAARRDRNAALRFAGKPIRHNAMPEEITIAKSAGDTAAIGRHNNEPKAGSEILQVKLSITLFDQDQRTIERFGATDAGVRSFWSAAVTPTGNEVIRMIRKGQLLFTGKVCPVRHFSPLAE